MDHEEKMNENIQVEDAKNNDNNDIFSMEEIDIEEMAIDGICGVY
jgi:mycofactocin precursor